VRWYQAAAFQPFFRSHAHLDSKRREPWIYSEGERSLIRDAIRTRYSFLPFWYTQFYETERTGVPMMRPLWYEFPGDEATFSKEGQHMVGDALLVAPVLHKGATQVAVLFPGAEIWYDIEDSTKYDVAGELTIKAPYDKIPVFQRGGTIITRRHRVRRSSVLMHEDPVTLHIAVDKAGKAEGTLYLDDGMSFDYKKGKYLYIKFKWDNGNLEAKFIDPAGMKTEVWVEKILVMGGGPANNPAKIVTKGGETYVDTMYEPARGTLTIRKPGMNLGEEFTLSVN